MNFLILEHATEKDQDLCVLSKPVTLLMRHFEETKDSKVHS